jgi:hypothetical protein
MKGELLKGRQMQSEDITLVWGVIVKSTQEGPPIAGDDSIEE